MASAGAAARLQSASNARTAWGLKVESSSMVDDTETLRRILKATKTIAVVGLSAQWHRPSYFAAKYLQDHGYRIIPVNPSYSEVLGQRCYPSITDIAEQVGIVDCFRR